MRGVEPRRRVSFQAEPHHERAIDGKMRREQFDRNSAVVGRWAPAIRRLVQRRSHHLDVPRMGETRCTGPPLTAVCRILVGPARVS